MDFRRHVEVEVLRAYLKESLTSPVKDVVKWHLSFCTICQGQIDELLLDDSNYPMLQVVGRPNIQGHIEERLLKELWRGKVKEQDQLKRIAGHCLACRVCRNKVDELWLSEKDESVLAKLKRAVGFSFIPSGSSGHSWRPHLAFILLLIFLPLTFISTGVYYLVLRDAPRAPVGDRGQGDVANKVQQPQESPQTGVPVKTPTPGSLVERPADRGATARHKANPKPRALPRARMADVTEISGRGGEAQNLNFGDSTEDLSVRGANEGDGLTNTPLIVSSLHSSTPLLIELPENSKKGWYEVSLLDPANLDLALDKHEVRSSDGKQIYVLLNLRRLPEKVYQLRITRKDKKRGAEAELRYISVLVNRPKKHGNQQN
jgi:hypothetical protein